MATGDIIDKEERRDYFISESGLELKLKKVSRFLVVDAGKTVKMPKVPVVHIEDKGRDEENPNYPDYIVALQEANYQRVIVSYATLLAMGTEVARLPSTMEGPETDEWIDTLLGLDIVDVPKDNKKLRYAAWLKYVGLPDGVEFEKLTTQLLRFSGLTTEADVAKAEETFRGEAEGSATTTGLITAPDRRED